LEQFLHPFESRGFVSVSWAFLFITRLVGLYFIGFIQECTPRYQTLGIGLYVSEYWK